MGVVFCKRPEEAVLCEILFINYMKGMGSLVKDLSFIKELKFEVSADGMEKSLLAMRDSFPQGVSWVSLDITPDIELKTYLKAGNMIVWVSGSLTSIPPETAKLQITFLIRVDVNVV